jgi:ribosomal protein S18 acetylase RimI-like enzyme
VTLINQLSPEDKQAISKVCNVAFNQPTERDYVSMVQKNQTTVSLLRENGVIGGVAFLDHESSNVDPQYSAPKYSHVHSIAISPEFRGRGLCKDLVKPLVKQFGDKPMYLNVRTTLGNPNVSAIKCYRRNGFEIVPTVNAERPDGPNSLMVRDGSRKKRSKRSRRKGKRSRKRSKR